MGIPGDMANHAEFHEEIEELRKKCTRLEERLASAQAQARAGADMLERERDIAKKVRHELADLRAAHGVLEGKIKEFIEAECNAVSAKNRADERFRALRLHFMGGSISYDKKEGGSDGG